MRLTKKEIDELITLIEHVRIDINYGSGGTFRNPNIVDDDVADKKEIKKVERAINTITKIILNP